MTSDLPARSDLADRPNVDTQLSCYPRISSCPAGREHGGTYLAGRQVHAVLAATLAHHDSGHVEDPLTVAGPHFG